MTLFKRDGTSEGSASVVSPKVSLSGQGSVTGGGELALDDMPVVREAAETVLTARKRLDDLKATRTELNERALASASDKLAALQARLDAPSLDREIAGAEVAAAQATIVYEAIRDRERAAILAERMPHERDLRRALLKALEQAAERVRALFEYKEQTAQRIGGLRSFESQEPDWAAELLDDPSSFCQAGRESGLTTWRRVCEQEKLL